MTSFGAHIGAHTGMLKRHVLGRGTSTCPHFSPDSAFSAMSPGGEPARRTVARSSGRALPGLGQFAELRLRCLRRGCWAWPLAPSLELQSCRRSNKSACRACGALLVLCRSMWVSTPLGASHLRPRAALSHGGQRRDQGLCLHRNLFLTVWLSRVSLPMLCLCLALGCWRLGPCKLHMHQICQRHALCKS